MILGYAVILQLDGDDGWWSLNDDDVFDSLDEADEACAEKTKKRRRQYGPDDRGRLFVVALSRKVADERRREEAQGG